MLLFPHLSLIKPNRHKSYTRIECQYQIKVAALLYRNNYESNSPLQCSYTAFATIKYSTVTNFPLLTLRNFTRFWLNIGIKLVEQTLMCPLDGLSYFKSHLSIFNIINSCFQKNTSMYLLTFIYHVIQAAKYRITHSQLKILKFNKCLYFYIY